MLDLNNYDWHFLYIRRALTIHSYSNILEKVGKILLNETRLYLLYITLYHNTIPKITFKYHIFTLIRKDGGGKNLKTAKEKLYCQ
jgi:hypothetical protein